MADQDYTGGEYILSGVETQGMIWRVSTVRGRLGLALQPDQLLYGFHLVVELFNITSSAQKEKRQELLMSILNKDKNKKKK